MRTFAATARQTFTCPTCELSLQCEAAKEGLRLDYDIGLWQRSCRSARLGTPCACPDFRPQLWRTLVEANRPSKAR